MTPEDLALVDATATAVAREPERFARAFYDRLFALDPGARSLFTADAAEQRSKLVAEVLFLSEAVHDLDGFVERARDLGRRHGTYGVRVAHYPLVEEALVAGITEVLGAALDDATVAAWRRLYALIAETMMEGASASLLR